MPTTVGLYNKSRLQKVETRKLKLAGTGERLMISNSYNRHNSCYRCSPVVPARKNLLFAGGYNKLWHSTFGTPKVEFYNLLKKLNIFLTQKVELWH